MAYVSAVNNPDSTVHLLIDTLPPLCSWKISRSYNGGTEHVRQEWGKVFWDSCADIQSPVEYRVELVDGNGNAAGTRTVTSGPWTVEPRPGILFPNKHSKLVAGRAVTIMWNPQSFPGDSVCLCIQYYHFSPALRATASDYLYDIPNSGGRRYTMLDKIKGVSIVGVHITICDKKRSNLYSYSADAMEYPPGPSPLVTAPACGDSALAGFASPLAWNKNFFSGAVGIELYDAEKRSVGSILSNAGNSGELAWSVPPVPQGAYQIKIRQNDSLFLWSFPFFIKR